MQSSFITNNGIPSGFPSLDKITGGWKNRDLIVVGSRPTVGNTAFGLNVAVNVAMNMHLPVMFYSLEMSTEYIAKRLLYSHANAEGNIVDRISNLDEPEWQQLEKRLLKLAKAPIYINDTPCLGISDFCEKAPKHLSETGVKLIIIDMLQLMRGWPDDRGRRADEVNHIVQTLKETAIALGVPIIVLSQLNRLIRKDGRAHLKPTLKDIRETSAVEECADMVILLDRPSEKELEEHPEMEGEAEFIVAVNKHGRTGSVPMRFDKDSLSFVDPKNPEDTIRMNKKYYWQKTEKCSSCIWNDNPEACHYYGYRFWPELPLADDCWQFLTPEQWKDIQSLRFERDRLNRWDQIRHQNHPDLPAKYQPPYALHFNCDPYSVSLVVRKMFFEVDGDGKIIKPLFKD